MLIEKEKMMKEVKVVDLINYINDEYNYDDVISLEDFVEGSGVYSIVIGSRGYVEEIKKVEDFKLKSVDELVEELIEELGDDLEDLESFEEFIDSGEIDWNDLGGVFEGLSEEDRIEYYNVVV
jgi:hypothetical protein